MSSSNLPRIGLSKSTDDLEPILGARQPLKEEIQKFIAEHGNDDFQSAPFMPADLVVMAILDSDTKWVSQARILRWIVDNFFCYRKFLLDTMEEEFECGSGNLDLLEALDYKPTPTLAQAFASHDIPLIDAFDSYGIPIHTVDINPARLYLSGCLNLDSDREGAFPFLDLPAELRNRIYEMVLIYPRSTVAVTLRSSGGASDDIKLSAIERDSGNPYFGEGEQRYDIEDPSEIMNLAFVCEQIARETIPILYVPQTAYTCQLRAMRHLLTLYFSCSSYGGNTFQFSRILFLKKFIDIVPDSRLRFLKKLDITIEFYRVMSTQKDDEICALMDIKNKSPSRQIHNYLHALCHIWIHPNCRSA